MTIEPELRRELDRFPAGDDVRLTDVNKSRTALRSQLARIANRESRFVSSGMVLSSRLIPSRWDEHEIPVRVYLPAGGAPIGGLVYLHGGAFVLGDLDTEDETCRRLAAGANCVVVSVDYRLAPEHAVPNSLEDGYSVLSWLQDHAGEFTFEPDRLAIGGCSAGAALAAGVAQASLDRGGPPVRLQLLLCPVLDASLSTASMRELASPEQLEDLASMWSMYMGDARPDAPGYEYASPAGRSDLAGLPPAYISAGELDPLRDEAVEYARRLVQAGVPLELHLWSGAPHAFELLAPDASVSETSVATQCTALRRHLAS